MSILREVVASIEDSSLAADRNSDKRSVPLTRGDGNHTGVKGSDYSMVTERTARQNAALRYVPNTMLHSFRSRMSNRFSARGLPSQSR